GVAPRLFDRLGRVSEAYESAFLDLVRTLHAESVGSEYLRFLTFRLDFNEFYRDQLNTQQDIQSDNIQQDTMVGVTIAS
ncbi:unnamed protein product, partial [Heterosigma akashiwo]